MKNLQRLCFNAAPQLVRHDSIGERKYLVVPMVMMVEGVLNGDKGPIFYPGEEIAKLPQVWNTKPVVVYHPEENGEGSSACVPSVLNSQSIGIILNACYEKKKKRLKAEAWVEESLVSKIDNRIAEAIENNKMMELSTGLFIEIEETEGVFEGPNGKENYTAIARNLRPDHLAVLPDKIGACSIKDGAGFIRNEEHPVDNEMSHESLRSKIDEALRKRLGEQNYPSVWTVEVFSDFFIYAEKYKYYRLNYSVDDNEVVTFSGEPQEVIRIIEYRTITGTFVGNSPDNDKLKTKSTMNKTETIKHLIDTGVWNADMKGFLDTQDEETLQKLKAQADIVVNSRKPAPPVVKDAPAEPKKDVTLNEYVSQAPAELRDVLVTMQSRIEEERSTLISKITTNKRNIFTENQLKTKPLAELEAIAALASIPAPVSNNYAGQGDAPSVTTNEENQKEALLTPDLFAK